MKELKVLAGSEFANTASNVYFDILQKREKAVSFKFNGVRVIMFDEAVPR